MNRFNQLINVLIVFIMLLAAASHRSGKVFGVENQSLLSMGSDTIQMFLPDSLVLANAGFQEFLLNEQQKGVWTLSSHRDVKIISTQYFGPNTIGYGGTIPLFVFYNADADSVLCVVEGRHDETPSFFRRIKRRGILSQWDGLSLDSICSHPVDVVSGATMSSQAVNSSVVGAVNSYLLKNPVFNVWESLLTWGNILVFLVVLGGVYVSFTKHAGKRWRMVQLGLNVLVLGFWAGKFVSFSLLLNWLANGVDPVANITMLLIVGLAVLMPFFGKKTHYCNWVCPYGSAQELAGKLTKKKMVISPSVLKYLNYTRQAVTLLVFLMLWSGFGFGIVDYEPFSAFLFEQAEWAVIIIAALFVLLSLFVNRPWCRFVCPTGQLLKWNESIK